jgi:hypothetical protein
MVDHLMVRLWLGGTTRRASSGSNDQRVGECSFASSLHFSCMHFGCACILDLSLSEAWPCALVLQGPEPHDCGVLVAAVDVLGGRVRVEVAAVHSATSMGFLISGPGLHHMEFLRKQTPVRGCAQGPRLSFWGAISNWERGRAP